jgi:hypothetical protein
LLSFDRTMRPLTQIPGLRWVPELGVTKTTAGISASFGIWRRPYCFFYPESSSKNGTKKLLSLLLRKTE